jgi:hypothetical protein
VVFITFLGVGKRLRDEKRPEQRVLDDLQKQKSGVFFEFDLEDMIF